MTTLNEKYQRSYNNHADDVALIGNKIEEHNWRVVFNRDTGEFEKVATKVPYAACKKADCKLCTEIEELAAGLDEIAESRVIARGAGKATIYSIARLANSGWQPMAMAQALGCDVRYLREVIKRDIEADQWTVAEVARLFKHIFEVNNRVMYQLIPFTYEEVCEAVPRGRNGKLNFKGEN